ncbi:MAG: hypothetical protein AAB296_10000 [Candidatus Desantisbacteria bacterium]
MKEMSKKEIDCQPRILNEGYQPKGEKIDIKSLKPPVLKSAALKFQTSESEKK